MTRLTQFQSLMVLLASFGLVLVATAFVPPIPQDPAYHAFADTRTCLGIRNFADTVSNLGFAFVGLWGLGITLGRGRSATFDSLGEALPFALFFLGVALASIGSVYYHLAPDNDGLFWDRLPITLAFMALFGAIIADRSRWVLATPCLLPVLIAAGMASLLYWHWTEGQGRGDLRFYALVQIVPILALPLICWLFPQGRYTTGKHLFWAVFWYALAKVLEHSDATVFALTGNMISGHTLKHLAAAMAPVVVIRMLQTTRSIARQAVDPADAARKTVP